MKILNWLKEKLQTQNFNKKVITNLIVVMFVGIAIIIVTDFYKGILPGSTRKETDTERVETNIVKNSYVKELEDELSTILSKIQNTGRVSVMITLKSGVEIVPALDKTSSDKITSENDTEGGTRTINETNLEDKVVFMNEQGGNSKALVVKELNPEIKGVIVVADGAKDPKVKLRLSEAVQTVLDIPAFRVNVLERN